MWYTACRQDSLKGPRRWPPQLCNWKKPQVQDQKRWWNFTIWRLLSQMRYISRHNNTLQRAALHVQCHHMESKATKCWETSELYTTPKGYYKEYMFQEALGVITKHYHNYNILATISYLVAISYTKTSIILNSFENI